MRPKRLFGQKNPTEIEGSGLLDRPGSKPLINPPLRSPVRGIGARVAQLVEQATENRCDRWFDSAPGHHPALVPLPFIVGRRLVATTHCVCAAGDLAITACVHWNYVAATLPPNSYCG